MSCLIVFNVDVQRKSVLLKDTIPYVLYIIKSLKEIKFILVYRCLMNIHSEMCDFSVSVCVGVSM